MSKKPKKAMTRLTIDIPLDYHKRLKALAAVCDSSIREILIQCIEERIFFKQPGNNTSWIAKEGDKADSKTITPRELEEFFSKLGI